MRRSDRLLHASKLPPAKTFETLDDKRLPKGVAPRLHELASGEFLDRATNVLCFGLPGTGKTHAACALGHRPDELVATAPDQVWCWDITYLRITVVGRFFYLYALEDLYSRKIVGWEIHEEESDDHSSALVGSTCADLGIDPRGLLLHSDNGNAMKVATMLATLQRLGIVPSFQPTSRERRQPLHRVAVSNLEISPGIPQETLPDSRQGSAMGGRLHALVQRRPPA